MFNDLRTSDNQKLTFTAGDIKVKLEGKHIGNIRYDQMAKGYRYWPKGSKTAEDRFSTIELCQLSLK
jgi:hypothetical protein